MISLKSLTLWLHTLQGVDKTLKSEAQTVKSLYVVYLFIKDLKLNQLK